MVLLVTKVVLSERICFRRLKQIQNMKVVTFQPISIMSSRNSEDSFETLPHTPDQALCLLLMDTLVIAGVPVYLTPWTACPLGASQPRSACPPGAKLSGISYPPGYLHPRGASCPGRFILPPPPPPPIQRKFCCEVFTIICNTSIITCSFSVKNMSI